MKKLLALVLALVMSMSLVTISNAAFKDADKIDYDEAVEVMNAVGVLVGDEKGNFNAKENLTREQAAKIISYLLLGNKTAEALVGAAKFTDVAATRWSAGFVDYCASTGVVAGNGDGTFAPAGQLTGFQFAKMLLVALGYDAKIEGFTGTDWQINVSKVANQVGLFNGLSISGTAVLTREQAAQMCLNTLKAPLVEYSNKGGSLSVNGAVINIGASKAQYVTTTLAKEQRISKKTLTNTDTTLNGGYTVEFGEKYYPALELKTDSDAFDRPAHQWLHNNKKIGSYVDYDLMVAEYTTGVNGKTLYELLGSSIIKEYDISYYVNGKLVENEIKASNMIKTNTVYDYDSTGNGVLTQVFVNDDDKDITITSIQTFVAQALADYNTKKETISLDYKSELNIDDTISADDFASIADLKDDDVVLVTVAEDTPNKYVVQSIATPEKMENKEITKFTKESKLTTDGTEYKYSKKGTIWNELGKVYGKEVLDKTYNIYLDQYGYVIATEIYTDTLKYLFLTGYDMSESNLSIKTADAAAIFPDGTFKTIKINVADTKKNIATYNGVAANTDYVELRSKGHSQYNAWFSYSEKDGVYTLKPVSGWTNTEAKDTEGFINSAKVRLTGVVGNDTKKAYGNDDSVYITVDTDAVDGIGGSSTNPALGISKVTGIYTGVQNVDLKVYKTGTTDGTNTLSNMNYPRIGKVGAVFALFDSNNYVIAAIVVGEDNNSTDSFAYALKDAQNEYKSGDYYYWDFVAVKDGKIETLTVKEKYDDLLNGTSATISKNIGAGKGSMFKLWYDTDGYVVRAELCGQAKDYVYGTDDYTHTDINDEKVYNVGIFTDTELTVSGRTLYIGTQDDYGLTLVTGAPIVVAQNEKYTKADGTNATRFTYSEYATIAQALNALANKAEFKGYISAALNDKGTAEFIVINSGNPLDITTDDGTTPTNGDLTIDTMTYSANAFGANQGGFVIELSNEVAIANATKYTVTITNKDGAKLLSASDNISRDIAADAGVEIKVAYSAVLGTGSYVVNVTIGDMAASDVMLVA